MIELKEGNFALNEDLIALARPLEGGGTNIKYQTYYVREGNWAFENLEIDEDVEQVAEKANLKKATQENGKYLYFNPDNVLSAKQAKDGVKLRFPVDIADSSSPVARQEIRIEESLSKLGVG